MAIASAMLSSSSSSLWSLLSSVFETKAMLLFFLSPRSFKTISKVWRDPTSSSIFIVEMSCASSIAVTFISNLLGRDLRSFLDNFSSEIFSPKASKEFAMSRRLK
ncbi:gag-protease polyprotein [Trifolium repens]|nr:gag-protease polyprotein [Trifolium repens]